MATPAETPAGTQAGGSNWWYVAVAVPLLSAIMLVVGIPVVLAGILLGLRVLFLVVLGLLIVGFPLFVATLLLPVALYKDIEYVQTLDIDWDPDRDLYVMLGVAGIFVNLLSPAVSLYYLYQRHVHVGRP